MRMGQYWRKRGASGKGELLASVNIAHLSSQLPVRTNSLLRNQNPLPLMFLKQILPFSMCCLAATLVSSVSLRAENKIPDEFKTSGFFIGCQAYTFNHFTVFEAIEKTAKAGRKSIEFYPRQKLTQEKP